MKNQNRRDFIKFSVAAGVGSTLITDSAKAGAKNILSPDRMGVLVDTTVCIGCGNCERACRAAHNLPSISEDKNQQMIQKEFRRPDDKSLTVVNKNLTRYEKDIFVKVQCMHCDHPACVSACIVGAFSKEENGSVIWDTDKCIGCRYCMVACPFQIPSFEYDKAINPSILKCDFCFNRTTEGLLPACVENCPMEVLLYGPRTELVRIARERIKKFPERYVNHIYGESEVGGTAWMYLSTVKFSQLNFPKLGKNEAPGVSESIQHGIFSYFIPPVSLYALLGGIMWITKRKKENKEEE
ncbi:MAG TPA: 4Fe-4S dicluster domain-containing protein [Ignavibacteriaceae bacterium]|nr:4Fe-4S dicluster domain-containing protein [Ignavibacteriaceae bacterium]